MNIYLIAGAFALALILLLGFSLMRSAQTADDDTDKMAAILQAKLTNTQEPSGDGARAHRQSVSGPSKN